MQNNFNIPTVGTLSGIQLVEGVNDGTQSLASNSSGGSAPSTPYDCQFWADTTSHFMQLRDEGNSAFFKLFPLGIPLPNQSPQSDVASASTTDIGANTSTNIRITGTTTITSLGTAAAGVWREVRFADALTLTYNATSLILPTAANITTATNDCAEFISLGSGNWMCRKYLRADGTPLVLATASTSTRGGVILATAAETLAGTDTNKALTAAGMAGNKSLSTNGYYKLPGGLIVQWGYDSAGATSISFPISFSSACYMVVASASGGTNQSIKNVTGWNTTGFSVSNGNAGSNTIWVAFGV